MQLAVLPSQPPAYTHGQQKSKERWFIFCPPCGWAVTPGELYLLMPLGLWVFSGAANYPYCEPSDKPGRQQAPLLCPSHVLHGAFWQPCPNGQHLALSCSYPAGGWSPAMIQMLESTSCTKSFSVFPVTFIRHKSFLKKIFFYEKTDQFIQLEWMVNLEFKTVSIFWNTYINLNYSNTKLSLCVEFCLLLPLKKAMWLPM